MNAEEMKLKCMAIAGEIADLYDPEDYETPEESDMARAANRACLSVINSIAAIPVEADSRDAQIATLREALKPYFQHWEYQARGHSPKSSLWFTIHTPVTYEQHERARAAIVATELKGDAK